MASSEDQGRQNCCFQEWMNIHQEDLSELLQAQNPDSHDNDDDDKNDSLRQLVEKSVQHFQDYMQRRQGLACEDVSPFFAPKWCTSLENSLLWVAGCRPSMFIRLIYALCGTEIESKLTEFLQGVGNVSLGGLNTSQLKRVNDLRRRIIREEDKLSSRLASLQEEIADQPIAMIVKKESQSCESNGEMEKALDDHERAMMTILEEADQLRLSTLKELMSILSSAQAVDFLVASKKLHICLHKWGKKRDIKHGRD